MIFLICCRNDCWLYHTISKNMSYWSSFRTMPPCYLLATSGICSRAFGLFFIVTPSPRGRLFLRAPVRSLVTALSFSPLFPPMTRYYRLLPRAPAFLASFSRQHRGFSLGALSRQARSRRSIWNNGVGRHGIVFRRRITGRVFVTRIVVPPPFLMLSTLLFLLALWRFRFIRRRWRSFFFLLRRIRS